MNNVKMNGTIQRSARLLHDEMILIKLLRSADIELANKIKTTILQYKPNESDFDEPLQPDSP